MLKMSSSVTSDTAISKPAHDENKRDTPTKSSTLKSLFKKSVKGFEGTLKKRKIDIVRQSPDYITEEERSRLRGGGNTREYLHKYSSFYYEAGILYFKMENYEKAQEYFLMTLSARLMLYGASSYKVTEVQESLGYTALLQGDTKQADYHFDIVERRRGIRPVIQLAN
uniref:Uncharacterized protein n=1 Tax=Ditylum brightwellii TaxID=49249 RepID=A0A6S9D0E7_9STRA|mmetsp:Transcript_1190/g.1479  ORF Transcript_1190/g.1479 Transcript_1190/m.1479 type:complete len:168 (+) Transcript_1190:140-643(+)